MNEITLGALRRKAVQDGVATLEETIAAMKGLQRRAIDEKDNVASTVDFVIAGHALWWLNSLADLDPSKPPVRGWPE
jgi:hypothetical protein